MKYFYKTPAVIIFTAVIGLLLLTTDASAAINNDGIMDEVLNRFQSNASSWASIFESAATRLFWTLVLISMVWTFGMMALRRADIGEFFAELVRFTIFTGFFWWLLINGPAFARSIINSLRQLGGSAAGLSGYSADFMPSEVVDIGFIMLGKTFAESDLWSPIDSAFGIVLGLIVLAMTVMIAVNVLMLYISSWIMAYGGIFFLGFGGSRWTSEMAINYFKAVLGLAVQIMAMILIIGIGVSLINDYYTKMQPGIELSEMVVIAVVIFTILPLTNKVPQLLSGIITGHAPGGMGVGQFGAGAMLGAAGTAAAATAMAGSMISSGAAEAAGGMSALKAAFSAANTGSSGTGGEMLAAASDMAVGDADSVSESSGISGETPFAKAAGFSSDISGGSAASAPPDTRVDQTPGNNRSASSGGFVTNLAHGAADVAKAKVDSVMEYAKERIADTTGGRIADAIRAMGADSSGTAENSLASVEPNQVDTESEVAAFVNRDNDSKSA